MAKGMTAPIDEFQPKTREKIDFDSLWQEGVQSTDALKLIDPALVDFEEQVRERIDPEALANRRASIAQNREKHQGIEETGILQPVMVRRNLDAPAGQTRYICVLGEIRTRAAQELEAERQKMEAAGRTDFFFHQPFLLPIIEMPTRNSREILLLQLAENEQRNDLAPDEAGRAYIRLERDGMKPAEIAHQMGLPLKTIEGRIGIAQAPADVQVMAAKRPDCVALVRELKRLTTAAERKPFLKMALEIDDYQQWKYGIQKVVDKVRERANILKQIEKAAKKVAPKAAPPSNGSMRRSVTVGAVSNNVIESPETPVNGPQNHATPIVSPVSDEREEQAPPLLPPPLDEWQIKHARAVADLRGSSSRLALETGRIAAADITVSEVIQGATDTHRWDDLAEAVAEVEKQVEIARRHLSAIEAKCRRIRFNADIEDS